MLCSYTLHKIYCSICISIYILGGPVHIETVTPLLLQRSSSVLFHSSISSILLFKIFFYQFLFLFLAIYGSSTALKLRKDISCDSFFVFFHVMESERFVSKFSTLPLEINDIFVWFLYSPNMAAAEFLLVMNGKDEDCKQELEYPMLFSNKHGIFNEIEVEQLIQIGHAWLPVHLSDKKD